MQKKVLLTLIGILLSGFCFAQSDNAQDSVAVVAQDSVATVQDSVAISANGVLSIQSSTLAGVWLNGQAVGNTPFSMEVPAGWVIYSLRAPGYWSEVFIANIEASTEIQHEVPLKKYELDTRELPDVSHINDLKVLESLYDSLGQRPVETPSDSVCLAIFVADYPLPVSAPSPLEQTSSEYREYYETYINERQLSFNEWYTSCSDPQQHLNGISRRINELGTTQISGFIPVVGGKFDPTDSSGLKGDLVLYLRSPDGRADVFWKGVWENDFLTGDALVIALTSNVPAALSFLTAQNKTIWIPVESGFSRHFFKYHELNISWNGLLFSMEGDFILPEWLASVVPQPEAAPEAEVAAPVQPELAKALLAKIPGGNFNYRGKDMQMRPFAMNVSAVDQGLYKAMCGKKDFGKFKGDSLPAHSVNWKEANKCCVALGGELPTKAEWEYAARAGSPSKFAWSNDANPKDFAEFNSAKPAPVAGKKPNGWGLHDMFGNVAEWVQDDGFWFGKYKYLKGGSWKSKKNSDLTVESHAEEDARYWGTHTGFRCVFKN
ncbi:MAG: formylglycine-generating enzyme family protein [Fibromonadaceae bacterium]|jgi:hypothetical protein|nr:formylglycine-generating enzyme family protein [Fibromonadaceae bacterium]